MSSSMKFRLAPGVPHPFAILRAPVLLLLDVDGVVRSNVEGRADPGVISAAKRLMVHPAVHSVVFCSGSSVDNDTSIEEWRRGNLPLRRAFENCFSDAELRSNKVAIYGQVGVQRLRSATEVETLQSFTVHEQCVIGCTLLQFYLLARSKEDDQQREHIKRLYTEASAIFADLMLMGQGIGQANSSSSSPKCTSGIFERIAESIRSTIDPMFRLVSQEGVVEFHSSCVYDIHTAPTSVQRKLAALELERLSKLNVFSGVAHRGGEEFAYLVVMLSNKGLAATSILASAGAESDGKKVSLVTIGDGGVDYPMHAKADASFHVGRTDVWEAGVRDGHHTSLVISGATGEGSQHVRGTQFILEELERHLNVTAPASRL